MHVSVDRTLRVKVIDACGLTCTFCHNEGTPVTGDNLRRPSRDFTAAGGSGRISIYLATNGAQFLPAAITSDDGFVRALGQVRDSLGLTEVHLTGGEPTLHPHLADVVRVARTNGYEATITSNGENGARALPRCAQFGLSRVNFSIFGTTPEELSQVQHAKYADRRRAQRKIDALHDSIRTAFVHGLRASANIVVPNADHQVRVRRLLDQHSAELSVRLLNSLDDGPESIQAILDILDELGAVPVARHVTAGVSGHRTAYRLPSGRIVYFKQIRPVRLPETCAGCRFNNDTDCQEGYYGVRLYKDRAGNYQVGVCIQRMDLCQPLDAFVTSDLRHEIIALREADYRKLVSTYACT